MKKVLRKDKLTQKFGLMNLIQPNLIYNLKGYRKNSKLNLVRLSKKYSHEIYIYIYTYYKFIGTSNTKIIDLLGCPSFLYNR